MKIIRLPFAAKSVLGCGSHGRATFCLTNREFAYVSQDFGNLEEVGNFVKYKRSIAHTKKELGIIPSIIAHDLHPDYISTKLAAKQKGKKIGIQHHHAHIASVMAEHQITEDVIGVACDGTGLGTDGNLWGCEFMICNYDKFERKFHLRYALMPGGAAAVLEPKRMLFGYLYEMLGAHAARKILKDRFKRSELKAMEEQIYSRFNAPLTSGLGRLFDAAASLILKIDKAEKAEAAIQLEKTAAGDDRKSYSYKIHDKIIDPAGIFSGIISDMEKGVEPSVMSRRFHNTVVDFIVDGCNRLLSKYGKDTKIVLSGGSFNNKILVDGIKKQFQDVYMNKKLGCGDVNISLGQCVIASKRG